MTESGGGLLQTVNRDTCKVAFKASAISRGGAWHPIYKEPVTDPGKISKAGRLSLVRGEKGLETISGDVSTSLLQTVFYNGNLCAPQGFGEIRERALRT